MKKVIAAVTICVLCIVAFASVTTESNRSGPYNCDGNDVTFEFDFPIEDTGDLIVILTDTTTAEPTVLTETTHYTVSATNNDYFAGPGGLVTTVSAYASGYTITIIRDTSKTHDSEYEVGGRLDTEAIGASFDKQTMMIQDLNDLAKTALRVPIGEGPIDEIPNKVERASKYAAYDPNGNPIVTEGTGDATPHTTFAAEFASKENAAEARATLDAQKQFCIDVTEAPYCAVGDGVTDDTAAIQAAWDAAYSAGGGTIFIPVGIYLVNLSKVVGIDVATVIFEGQGQDSVLMANASDPVISITPAVNYATHIIFKDLTIDGNSKASHGLELTNCAFISFERCKITDCNKAIWFYGSLYNDIVNCDVIDNIDGLYQEHANEVNPNLNRIIGGAFRDNSRFAIFSDYGLLLQIRGTGIEGNGTLDDSNTAAVKLQNMGSGNVGNAVIIDGVWFEANKGKADLWAVDCVAQLAVRDTRSVSFQVDYTAYLDTCRLSIDGFISKYGGTIGGITTIDCSGVILNSRFTSEDINSDVLQFPIVTSSDLTQATGMKFNYLNVSGGITSSQLHDVNKTQTITAKTTSGADTYGLGFKHVVGGSGIVYETINEYQGVNDYNSISLRDGYVYIRAPSSVPPDDSFLTPSSLSFWLDETNDEFELKAKKSDDSIISQTIQRTFNGSATWDPGSLADGVGETSAAITVTGAALGDFVLVSAPYDLQGITCNGYVSDIGAVKIRLQNETGDTIDLASGTFYIRVIKK